MALELSTISANVSPMLSDIMNMAAAVSEGAGATVLIKFVLDGIQALDESVGNFIKELGEEGFSGDLTILDRYYDATLKCKTAALNVLRNASVSHTQLSNLQGALNHLNAKDGSAEYKVAEADALKEIKSLDCTKFNLPDTLLDDLEAAKAAYEGVIQLCTTQVTKTQNMESISLFATMGLIILGAVLAPVVVTAPVLFLTEAAAETLVALTFVVGGCTTIFVISSVVGKRVMELCKLTTALKEQWQLLTTAQSHMSGLVVGIGKLQVEVERLQIDLHSTSEATGSAQRLNNLARLRDKVFLDDLDQQIGDINELKQSCRQLTRNVLKAFDLFLEKNSIITSRITLKSSSSTHKLLTN